MPPASFLVSRGRKPSNISRLAPKDFHFEFVDVDFVNKLFVAKVLVIRLYSVARSYLLGARRTLPSSNPTFIAVVKPLMGTL